MGTTTVTDNSADTQCVTGAGAGASVTDPTQQSNCTATAAHATDNHTDTGSSSSSSRTGVSAANDADDGSVSSSETIDVANCLCLALYYPTAKPGDSNNNDSNSNSHSPIWWPAIQLPSIRTFVALKHQELATELASSSSSNSNSLTKKEILRIKQKLNASALQEVVSQTQSHTLYYLSRPLWEYQTAKPPSAAKKQQQQQKVVQVQDFTAGIKDTTRWIRRPHKFSSKQLYLDFHRAWQEAHKLLPVHSDDDDDEEDNEADQAPEEAAFLTDALRVWEQRQQHELERQEERAILPVPPQPLHHDDDEQDYHDDQADRHHRHHRHASPMAQSVAAVSYTEDSLVSVNTSTPARNTQDTTTAPSNSTSPTTTITHPPPPLPSFPAKTSFDTIWHKHEVEGWDRFQDADTNQDVVYQAPNGYTFPSQLAFEQYLQHTYGWEPPPLPGQLRKSSRQRRLDQQRQQQQQIQHQHVHKKSRRGQARTVTSGLMWKYLKELGWTYDSAPRDMLGCASWVYYRPGFHNKHRGVLGQDHFLNEDDMIEYCQQHAIAPPPTPGNTSEEDNYCDSPESHNMDREEMETDQTDDDESMEASASLPADDSGYETPTDQAPTPQDPGKPLYTEPTPDDSEYSNDEDRYYWPILWSKLQRKGWQYKRAPNVLEDWWYIKPVRALNLDQKRRDLKRGVDYFTSPDDVIAYCQARDAKFDNGKKKTASKRSSEEEISAQKSKSTKDTDKPPRLKRAAVDDPPLTPTRNSKKRGRAANDPASTNDKKGRTNNGRTDQQQPWEGQNLTIDPASNTAPWASNAPLFEHKVIVDASVGFTYNNAHYYLPGDNARSFTERFESVTDLVQYCVRFDLGHNEDSTSRSDYEFSRYLRYAFVPGKSSEWAQVRMITKAEAFSLLQKAGYRPGENDGNEVCWKPPKTLVDMGFLESTYPSFHSLCLVLVRIDDLENPGGNSRRRQQGKLSHKEVMALRLAMAEGFANEKLADREPDTKTTAVNQRNSNIVHNNAKQGNVVAISKMRKSKKRAHGIELTSDAQKALSPDKIKVKVRREENTAPWAVNPFSVPLDGWSKCYLKMGCTYTGGYFYLPGESFKTARKRFTKTSELQAYACQEGDYDKYLDKLDEEERSTVRRHFNYGNVCGHLTEWILIRALEQSEVIMFLNLLGFEKGVDGSWSVPDGLPLLEGQKYPSLSALGRALVRVPDLEDRTRGEFNRRWSKKKNDQLLNQYQMMALRLRLAEGLEDDTGLDLNNPSPFSGTTNVPGASDSQMKPLKPLARSITVGPDKSATLTSAATAKVERFIYEICSNSRAWTCLQVLGCKYASGRYRLPGDSSPPLSTQNELVQYILEHGTTVLDWDHCTLTSVELEELELYLRCFTAKLNSHSPTGAALRLLNERDNINKYLERIGIVVDKSGMYRIGARSDQYETADIVHKIRITTDLYSLADDGTTTPRKRRSNDNSMLSDLEMLALRLWSITIDTPLANFRVPPVVLSREEEHAGMGQKGNPGFHVEIIQRASKVMDCEEVPTDDNPNSHTPIQQKPSKPAGEDDTTNNDTVSSIIDASDTRRRDQDRAETGLVEVERDSSELFTQPNADSDDERDNRDIFEGLKFHATEEDDILSLGRKSTAFFGSDRNDHIQQPQLQPSPLLDVDSLSCLTHYLPAENASPANSFGGNTFSSNHDEKSSRKIESLF